jgi:hypothetical protein
MNSPVNSSNPLSPIRYLHTIHAAPECVRLRGIYMDVFGGLIFAENYYAPEDRDAVLLYVADHMIEIMSPHDPENMDFMYARYVKKTGPSYHSISFSVADADAAVAACAERGLLLNTTGPGLLYLHPKSTGGIIMELTHHRMPNDPWDSPSWNRDWSKGRDDRPHALAHIVCAPRNPRAAIDFFCQHMDGVADPAFAISWPQPARATPVRVADATLLILEPDDPAAGPLVDFSSGPNSGVYALAWKVAAPEAAESWFAGKGFPLEPLGDGPWSHALVVDGARHWLAR